MSVMDLYDDRRRCHRVKVGWHAQILINGRREAFGKTVDVSGSGVAFAADLDVNLGDQAVCRLDAAEWVKGRVVRKFRGGFAIAMRMRTAHRDRLIARLMCSLNEGVTDEEFDIRAKRRKKPAVEFIEYTLPSGKARWCKIRDLSVQGAFVEARLKPEIGEVIKIGKMTCQVTELSDAGFSVDFVKTAGSETVPHIPSIDKGRMDRLAVN